MTNATTKRPAAFPNDALAFCGGGKAACGEPQAKRIAVCDATTLPLGEFGVDDVWVLLPLVLLNPHLPAVLACISYLVNDTKAYLFERAQAREDASASPRGVYSLWRC